MRATIPLALASIVGLVAVTAAPARARPTTHAPVALHAAHAAHAARTTPAPWSGVFRVQFALAGRHTAPAALVVERPADGLSGFILVDEKGLPLGNLRIDGDVLRARLTTEHGTGDLTLRITGTDVAGTFTVGKQRWDVTGQRTV